MGALGAVVQCDACLAGIGPRFSCPHQNKKQTPQDSRNRPTQKKPVCSLKRGAAHVYWLGSLGQVELADEGGLGWAELAFQVVRVQLEGKAW